MKQKHIVYCIAAVVLFVLMWGLSNKQGISVRDGSAIPSNTPYVSMRKPYTITTPPPSPTPEPTPKKLFDHRDIIMNSVDSTALSMVGYDSDYHVLKVQFKNSGEYYIYYDVPQSTYYDLLNADSIGSFFYDNVRMSFEYEKVSNESYDDYEEYEDYDDYEQYYDWPQSWQELEWMLEAAYEAGWSAALDEYGIEP